MMISLKHRTAFLAMPKTASSSIESVLRPLCDIQFVGNPEVKHMPVRKYQRFLPKILESYGAEGVETVCLFREPVDWLKSWYLFRSRPNIPNAANSTQGVSFDQFVAAFLGKDPPAYARLGRASAFVRDKDGGIGVDHIFRYENFPAFAAFLSDRFRTSFTFPTLNVSPEGEAELSPAMQARVEAEMAEDFRIWREVAR